MKINSSFQIVFQLIIYFRSLRFTWHITYLPWERIYHFLISDVRMLALELMKTPSFRVTSYKRANSPIELYQHWFYC